MGGGGVIDQRSFQETNRPIHIILYSMERVVVGIDIDVVVELNKGA